MATQAEYDAGGKATLEVVKAEIKQYVPPMFQSQIGTQLLSTFADAAAKAAIDAAEKVRGG